MIMISHLNLQYFISFICIPTTLDEDIDLDL
jgi:hypothetical protein